MKQCPFCLAEAWRVEGNTYECTICGREFNADPEPSARDTKSGKKETKTPVKETNGSNPETRKEGKAEKPKEGGMQGAPGKARQGKECREIPEVITIRWIYRARRSELEKCLAGKPGMENPAGETLVSLRKAVSTLISGKRRQNVGKGGNGFLQRRQEEKGNGQAKRQVEERLRSDLGVSFCCMRCGFRHELTPEGLRALQDGGAR